MNWTINISKSAKKLICQILVFANVGMAAAQVQDQHSYLTRVPVEESEHLGFIADPDSFPEQKMDFPIAAGIYEPTWNSINEKYPGEPAWWRKSKFGIFIHWGPQSSGNSGDWYARYMYHEGTLAYVNHLKDFGHPSKSGYKEVLHTWNPKAWDPEKLVQQYYDAGFRYALVVGVHHDNFDLWNSKYQLWNSVNVGPKKDFLAEWKKALKKKNMRFGVAFHHEYSWWWWQGAFGADKKGSFANVPYDGNLTLADGKGKWWEGLDPQLLYGIPIKYDSLVDKGKEFTVEDIPYEHHGIFGDHLEYAKWYATRWAMRMEDVIDSYDPDFIYTDGNSTQPFSGDKSGAGYKCDAAARVIAHYYNRAAQSKKPFDKISFVKFHPANRGVGTTFEGTYADGIKEDQMWMGDMAVGDWFYRPDFYYDAGMIIHALLEHVSRDGNLTLCVCLKPEGDLDSGSLRMLGQLGNWMKINGQGVYGSHAWKQWGEGELTKDPDDSGAAPHIKIFPGNNLTKKNADFRFSTKDFRFTKGEDNSIYAFCLSVPKAGEKLLIKAFGKKAGMMDGPVHAVRLLGSKEKVQWRQDDDGLSIRCPSKMPFKYAVAFEVSGPSHAK